MNARKHAFYRETIRADAFGQPCPPIGRVAVLVVVKNPFARRHVEDLSVLFDQGGEIGREFAAQAVAMLDNPAVSYGKAAIVGADGDLEHGGAMIHPKLGAPMRVAVGGGAALIPSNVKVGGPGTVIDLPLGHKDEAWSFDHFDTMSVMIADAPRADEILLCMGFSDGPRALPRCGSGPVRD